MFARRARALAVLVFALSSVAGGVHGVAPAGAARAPAGPPAVVPLRIGIADQKGELFSDPRYKALGIQYARLNVPWDVMENPDQTASLLGWLQGAILSHTEPLISFGHSLTHRRFLPTPEQFRFEFRRLRAKFPWVTTFATWNEANLCGEPTCHRPALVAAYYRALKSECPTCTILAAELLDSPDATSWARDFIRAAGFIPHVWGLHNYIEANRFRMGRLRSLLHAIPGADLWLTETGGLVSRHNNSTTVIPEGASHAGNVTRYIFDRIVPANPRIKRVYIYNWNQLAGQTNWDSALITPGGTPRASFYVLQRVLRFGPRLDIALPSSLGLPL